MPTCTWTFPACPGPWAAATGRSRRPTTASTSSPARLADLTVKLDWTLRGNISSVPVPDHQGSREVGVKNWDAVVGVKGRFLFGEGRRWSVPYYLDVGTGDSDLTTQAMIGLGYSFGWGEVVGAWRVLDYNMKPSSGLQDLTFSGPMVSAVFRW